MLLGGLGEGQELAHLTLGFRVGGDGGSGRGGALRGRDKPGDTRLGLPRLSTTGQ